MSFKNNIAYGVMDPALITQDKINCLNASGGFSSVADLTKNNANTKCMIKFNVDGADVFSSLTWLTQAEAHLELQKAEWQPAIL